MKKPKQPRFEVTQELELQYRNAEITPKDSIKQTYNLQGRVKGDFIKLAQKHPEYFANPTEAFEICNFILQNATIGIPASEKRFALIITPLQNKQKEYGALALRIENINREHRIRSVILMDKKQVDFKTNEAKEQGEPILHFW